MGRVHVSLAVATAATTVISLASCSSNNNDNSSSSGKTVSVIWVDTDGCVSAAQYCKYFMTSVTKNLSASVQEYATAASSGKFPTGSYVGTLANGGTGLAPYHDYASKVPSKLQSQLADVKSKIGDGSIKITSPSQPTGAGTPLGKASAAGNGKLTACMVLDTGGIDDKSFNQASYAGLQAAKKANPNINISYVPSNSGNDYTPNLRAETNKGCGSVIAVGGLMAANVKAIAKANPKVHYAEVDSPSSGPNVYGLQFNTAQGGFLGGYLAAGMTKTGKVATWGGLPIPPVTIYMDGFWEGVQYYNKQNGKDVQVLGWNEKNQKGGTFAQSFTDQNKGKQISQTFIQQGADIIFPVAGGAGLGAGAAAQAASS